MGRNLKGKGAKAGVAAQQKRRKKSALGAGGSSPALSASSSSGGTSTPGHRECEQCGNSMLLEGVAKAWPVGKKSVASTGCQICDFVAFRRAQRPCVQCARTGCDHFCEWCGKGFHAKCAKLRNEDVGNPNGFCCHKCESEQSEGHDTDEDEAKADESDEEDVGSRCGSCRLPFSTTAKEPEVSTGFKVNQAVLVDNDEVLYNALITEVDTKGERIKIHFTRWSKSFDDWYAMDDEHINESLACDCCNNWFHIGCLPPIKSSGRWKDSTYVCPRCIDDARAFHNGNRSVLKAKAAYISTSNAIAKAAKKVTSPKESETAAEAVAKTKKLSKAVVVMDDDDEDMEEKKEDNDDEDMEEKKEDNDDDEGEPDREVEVKIAKAPAKKKRKLSEVGDSPANARAKETANEKMEDSGGNAQSESNCAKPAPAKRSSPAASPSKADSPASEAKTTDAAKTSPTATTTKEKANAGVKADESTTPDAKAAAMMHASPEHTVKAATEAHSSPSKATTAKIGSTNKTGSEAKAEKQKSTASASSSSDNSNRHSSCNTVMSLLNSPPTNEAQSSSFKPTVTSLPMLNPAKDKATSSSKPSMAMPANFQVYVKMEQKNGRFPLCPRPMPNVKSVQAVRKEVSTAPKSSKPTAARKSKQGQPGAAGRGLSAFDILREVASQEIDEGAAPVKPKREKRTSTSRTSSTSANKRAKIDVSTSSSNASASPGCATSAGAPSHPVAADTTHSSQTRERIQMNSFVDLHFSIRKEMYLRFCRLEEEGMLTRDSAHLLRSLIYPTSERFQDLKFVYLVNKDLPSVQLTKRLLEAVPYPPAVAKPIATTVPHAPPAAAIRSPLGGKGIAGLPMTMGMFSAGLGRNSSPASTPRMGLLPPPPGSTLLRPEPPRPDESSRLASGSGSAPQSQPQPQAQPVSQPQPQPQPQPQRSVPVPAPATTAKRPEMLLMEQLAPTHRPVTSQPQQQPQQQQQRLLNSR
ncbi:hypothetical protein PHYSODRAFT_320511 [Phytophthora sojae]|uniref:Zinc finger PHD-type domain-containing protein n=1 Tax=Phytophthora sojae (strain P6497) TaxID=1094619 RepID=G4YI09_PHYSP|nr:hypothetical protein PHYSODRAFT_320511 [Phytophthora sojae]EGZ26596.1 hypothetical protein PHYSODRAFT_320511 [Phytophthora sojae]|eukprot:XP_009513871.1 hypothetical protein PHYSODRAFT_320511 [Phytophthora sojae]